MERGYRLNLFGHLVQCGIGGAENAGPENAGSENDGPNWILVNLNINIPR
jgi:hypothetical protein